MQYYLQGTDGYMKGCEKSTHLGLISAHSFYSQSWVPFPLPVLATFHTFPLYIMSSFTICHGLYKSCIDFVEKVNLLAAHKGRVNHSFLAQDDLEY